MHSLVFNKRYVVDSANVQTVIHDFGEYSIIQAVDLDRQRVATEKGIYSLADYKLLKPVPVAEVDHMLFDAQGDL